jgi:hypothetical protein
MDPLLLHPSTPSSFIRSGREHLMLQVTPPRRLAASYDASSCGSQLVLADPRSRSTSPDFEIDSTESLLPPDFADKVMLDATERGKDCAPFSALSAPATVVVEEEVEAEMDEEEEIVGAIKDSDAAMFDKVLKTPMPPAQRQTLVQFLRRASDRNLVRKWLDPSTRCRLNPLAHGRSYTNKIHLGKLREV